MIKKEEIEFTIAQQKAKDILLLSSRSLLRSLPLIFGARVSEAVAFPDQILLPIFRACEFSWVAGSFLLENSKYNQISSNVVAHSEAAQIFAVEMSSVSSSDMEYYLADSLVSASCLVCDIFSKENKGYSVESAVSSFMYLADMAEEISSGFSDRLYNELNRDCEYLNSGNSLSDLSSKVLWSSERSLKEAMKFVDVMKSSLLNLDENWTVWTKWYDERLIGKHSDKIGEISRISIPEEVWGDGAKFVNHAIQKLSNLKEITEQKQFKVGPNWIAGKEQIYADRAGDQRDQDAASNVTTQQLHEIINLKIERFSNKYSNIETEYGWDGFHSCLERLQSALSGPTEELPSKIVYLYDAAVELGSFLDLQHDLIKRKIGNQSPLDPLPAREFADLVKTSAIFIRAFPTALEADEAVAGFLTRPDLFAPAVVVVEAAGRRLLISKDDADWILGLLQACERSGFPSEKAGSRGIHGARNLAVSAATLVAGFLMGAVASDYSTKSPLVQEAGDFLLDAENEITELLAEGQSDIRHALASMIEESRKRDLPSKGPKTVIIELDSSRREEDDEHDSPGGGGGGSWG
ncbi:hypothetical protein [Roseibium sp. M-1]